MTRRELIAELEESFRKYPNVPEDAEVVYTYSTGDAVHVEYIKATIKNSQPVVMLI